MGKHIRWNFYGNEIKQPSITDDTNYFKTTIPTHINYLHLKIRFKTTKLPLGIILIGR